MTKVFSSAVHDGSLLRAKAGPTAPGGPTRSFNIIPKCRAGAKGRAGVALERGRVPLNDLERAFPGFEKVAWGKIGQRKLWGNRR